MDTKKLQELLEDPNIFQINRLKPFSSHKVYKDDSSLRRDLENKNLLNYHNNDFAISLNGIWKFNYSDNLSSRIINFYDKNFDDSGFDSIKVPSHIQMEGFDKPHYVNSIYPWDGHNEIFPPELPKEFNPTGQYVKYFSLNSISGKEVFIGFDGVETAFNIWVNGHYVGYSEDSFTPSHFDISQYVYHDKPNKLAVEVYKYSTGTWLENQDFWRLSGIFRDVTLYTLPKIHVSDMFCKTHLSDNYTKAVLNVDLEISLIRDDFSLRELTLDNSPRIEYKLLDENNDLLVAGSKDLYHSIIESSIIEGKCKSYQKKEFISLNISQDIANPKLWSAESPNLYSLLIYIYDSLGNLMEIVKENVGFRDFKMINKVMHINGKRIVFKGANRHDFSHVNGRAVTKEEMLWDATFMKQNNINASRSSHYPNQSYWYELCNIFGIYVIDETNLETHGTWQVFGKPIPNMDSIPGSKPEWLEIILDRANSMLQRDKNHPSILMWSCGNEACGGENLYKMSQMFRAFDETRLVQYEGVFWDRTYNDTSDVESRMYATTKDIEKYLNDKPSKPFISCEYTHSMGNSNGAMHKYTELEKYPMYQGGFIWDFIDQSLLTTNRYGQEYLAYGGDFGDRPTNYNFCVNGFVYGDRSPSPKVQEIKYLFQNFKLKPNLKGCLIENENLFTDENNLSLNWVILEDGYLSKSGSTSWTINPLSEKQIDVDYDFNFEDSKHEYVIKYSINTIASNIWSKSGHTIATGETVFGRYNHLNSSSNPLSFADSSFTSEFAICNSNETIGVKSKYFNVIFCKVTGRMVSLRYNDYEFIEKPPMPDFWLAPTDNDKGAKLAQKNAQWKIASLYAVSDFNFFNVKRSDDSAIISFVYNLSTSPQAQVKVEYNINSLGEIKVCQTFEASNHMADMPMFGMSLSVPCEFNQIEWYGHGKSESYSDRKHGSETGIFKSDAKSELSKYVIPQECGNHTDTRWMKLSNKNGFGLEFYSDNFFNFTAIPHTSHELELASHHYKLPPIHDTVVTISSDKMGVGGDDSWKSPPHEEYMLKSNKSYRLEYVIRATHI